MTADVALIDMKKHGSNSMMKAAELLGGFKEINTRKREVVLKMGVFHHGFPQYTTVDVTRQIIDVFDKAKRIHLVESDNYRGTGDERLQLWKELFNERVQPFNLSTDEEIHPTEVDNPIRDITIDLSHLLLKPNVFVSTHVLRSYTKGSVLKNLYGLPPEVQKAQYHKNEIFYNLLTTLFEVIGGIDLAVLDGSKYHHKFSGISLPVDILVVGRDAVAVETIGYALCGHKPTKIDTIQAFVEKGLGEGDLDAIQVLGADFDEIQSRVKDAMKKAKIEEKKLPKPWSPAKSVSDLIKSGYFKTPERRTREDVMKVLIHADSRAKGREKMIYATLQRRVTSGLLQGEKGPDGWFYWTS